MGDIFFKLLNMSITAIWLILVALLFRICFKKSPKWIRCVLWAMVAVRLVFPFTIKSEMSIVPSTETIVISSDRVNESDETDSDNTVEEPDDNPDVYKPSISINSGIKPIDDIFNSISENNEHSTSQTEQVVLSFYDTLGILWAVGVGVMLIYALASFIKIKRQVKASVSIEKNIMLCDNIPSPFILGIFRVRIYLPTSINEEDRKHIIAHETAHIKRGDHLWKPLGFAILSVYWFNPFIWLSYILLCRDIELACDEKVIKDYDKQDKADYSKALIKCSLRRTSVAACPLAFGETGVKERVKKVLNYKKPTFWIITVSLVACVTAALLLLTDPKENVDSTPEATTETTETTETTATTSATSVETANTTTTDTTSTTTAEATNTTAVETTNTTAVETTSEATSGTTNTTAVETTTVATTETTTAATFATTSATTVATTSATTETTSATTTETTIETAVATTSAPTTETTSAPTTETAVEETKQETTMNNSAQQTTTQSQGNGSYTNVIINNFGVTKKNIGIQSPTVPGVQTPNITTPPYRVKLSTTANLFGFYEVILY